MADAPYVLLVDDEETFHFLSRYLLEQVGWAGDVVEAMDGVQACSRLDADGPPALLVLDLSMPRMDGRSVLAAIEAGAHGTPPTVVVASSSPRVQDRVLAQRYPFVAAYVEKPLDRDDLLRCLEARPELRGLFTAL